MIMPETITIDITQEDIDTGRRGSCSRCPAALALIRLFIELGYTEEEVVVLMSEDEANVMFPYSHDQTEVYYETSPALSEFINRFDGWAEVMPITTTLRQVRVALM